MFKVVLNHKEIEVFQRINFRLKDTDLRVNSYGQIEIVTNGFINLDENKVKDFIQKSATYIQHKLDKLKSMLLPTFKNGSKVSLLGKEYTIYRSKRISKIVKDGNGIAIPRSYNITDIRYYLEGILDEALSEYIYYYTKHYPFEYISFRIMEYFSFWGRNVYQRKMNFTHLEFNIAIVFLPIELLDYIVLNELCRYRYQNNTKLFLVKLESIMPDWKIRRRLLNSYHIRWFLERLNIKGREI